MSNFASIKFISEYDKVVYYSVVINGDENEKSIFELFVENFTISEAKKLNHILSWIKEIGSKYGAYPELFRDERHATALPPNGKKRKPSYIEHNASSSNPLRLYCHRLNTQVVILFDGGIKTTAKAQDCPNVRTPFAMANILALKIDEAFKSGEIEWTDELDEILYEEAYKLYF